MVEVVSLLQVRDIVLSITHDGALDQVLLFSLALPRKPIASSVCHRCAVVSSCIIRIGAWHVWPWKARNDDGRIDNRCRSPCRRANSRCRSNPQGSPHFLLLDASE